jgi:hypothetical protein
MLIDHPDPPTTTAVLGAFRDSMNQPWIRRHAPRLTLVGGGTIFAVTGIR